MRFLKYEFANKAAFETFKADNLVFGEGEEISLIPNLAIVEIGDVVVTPAVMSEDGETVVTEAVTAGTHAIDVLWQGAEVTEEEDSAEFTAMIPFEVYPKPCGIHSFSGLSHLYTNEYYTKFPELKPVEEEL